MLALERGCQSQLQNWLDPLVKEFVAQKSVESKQTLVALDKAIADKRAIIIEGEQEYANLQDKMSSARTEIEALTNTLDDLQAQKRRMKEQIVSFETDLEAFKRAKANEEEELAKRREAVKREIAIEETKLEIAKNVRAVMQKTCHKKELDCKALETKKKGLLQDVAQIEQTLRKEASLQKSLQLLKSQKSKLEREVKLSVKNKDERLDAAKREVGNVGDAIKSHRAVLMELEFKTGSLEQEKLRLQNQLQQLREAKEHQCDEVQVQLQQLKDERSGLEEEIDKLRQTKLAEIQQIDVLLEVTKQERVTIESERKRLDAIKADIVVTTKAGNHSVTCLSAEKARLEADIDDFIAGTEEMKKDAAAAHDMLESCRQQCSSLSDWGCSLQTHINQLVQQKIHLESEVRVCNESLQQSKNMAHKAKAYLEKMKSEKGALEIELQQRKDMLQSAKLVQAEMKNILNG